MNFRPFAVLISFAALTGLSLLGAPAADAQAPAALITLRYQFTPGQTLRYLVQRDPYFTDPIKAIETTDPRATYRPPIMERLTETVQTVRRDGTATIEVTLGPEPGFEDETAPQPSLTRTVRVTPLGQVLTPVTDPALGTLLRAFFPLPAAPVQVGGSWKGAAFQGAVPVETRPTLTAGQGGRRGLAIITQTLPPVVTQSRSPDHDGTLLQTTRSAQADRIVFDLGAGNLRRQASTLTVDLSLVMTGRGARGSADFGHVIPNIRVIQTMTIERQDDPPALPLPAASFPGSPSPASNGRRSKS